MESLQSLIQTVVIAIAGGFSGSWLGAYLFEKGKNLATKEDIANITKEIEEVKTIYKSRYDLSKTERQFYNDMTEALQKFLADIKRYELEVDTGENSLTYELAMSNSDLKRKTLDFKDRANEILAKAFVFLQEENYGLLQSSFQQQQ